MTIAASRLKAAYGYCQHLANTHYENFPVASMLLPKHIRRAVSAIYAFARTADDIADEGTACQETRLEQMTKYEAKLYALQYGKPATDLIFVALQDTIESFNLPIQLFYDLLTAFRQDILKNRYSNFAQVLDYCHYSANPIGRLLLCLTGNSSQKNLQLSDNICTGLQLINFIQDIQIDISTKDRCYIPTNDLVKFNMQAEDLLSPWDMPQYEQLVAQQLARAADIYIKGIDLANNIPGLFGLEIRFIIACGRAVLDKLAVRTDLRHRPVMNKMDYIKQFCKVACSKKIDLSPRILAMGTLS